MKKEIRRLQKDEGTHAGLSAVAAPKEASMVAYVDWGQTAVRLASLIRGLMRFQSGSPGGADRPPGPLDPPWEDLVPRHFPSGHRWSTV